MDNSILKLLASMLSGQNNAFSSFFGENAKQQQNINPANNLYPPEAQFYAHKEQQSQPNIASVLSSILGKNMGDISSILSKKDTKKEESNSPSDVIL